MTRPNFYDTGSEAGTSPHPESGPRPLPCPFCGTRPEVREPRQPDDALRIACKSCGVSPEVFGADLADALEHWNRRSPPREARTATEKKLIEKWALKLAVLAEPDHDAGWGIYYDWLSAFLADIRAPREASPAPAVPSEATPEE